MSEEKIDLYVGKPTVKLTGTKDAVLIRFAKRGPPQAPTSTPNIPHLIALNLEAAGELLEMLRQLDAKFPLPKPKRPVQPDFEPGPKDRN